MVSQATCRLMIDLPRDYLQKSLTLPEQPVRKFLKNARTGRERVMGRHPETYVWFCGVQFLNYWQSFFQKKLYVSELEDQW